MNQRTVLVVENDSLLGASVENILTRELGLNVVGVTPANEAALIQAIWHARPAIVILNEASSLTDAMNLMARLKDYPQLRVVVVNTDNNLVQIYDKRQVLATPDNNLPAISRNGNSLPV